MNLLTLTIENLFCYRGRHTFDLSPPSTGGRNIVVIRARNGQGKTSFLNSLLLLFGGVTDDLRNAAATRGRPSHNGYVWGEASVRWEGILNRDTVKREGWNAVYGVAATLKDGADHITIRRGWTAGPSGPRSYTGALVVELNGQALKGDDVEDLLHARIPPTFLPYFFFDGELIQRLGFFSGESQEAAVRRLLELVLIARLGGKVGEFAERWAQEAADADTRRRLVELENERRLLHVTQQTTREAQDRVERRREAARVERQEAQARLTRSQVRISDERARIVGQQAAAREALREALARLYGQWLPVAPLVYARTVTEQAREALARATPPPSSPRDAQREVLRQLTDSLPALVFDTPPHSDPPLLPVQRDHYRARLRRQLEGLIPEAPTPAGWAGLGRATAERAGATLDRFVSLGAQASDALAEVGERRARLTELEAALANTADLPEEQVREHRRLTELVQSLSEEIGRLGDELKRLQGDLLRLGQRDGTLKAEIDAVMADLARRQSAQSRAGVATRAAAFLRDLERVAREGRRAQLTASLNTHFAELFSSNQQIGRLELDAEFHLRLLSPQGQPIEPGNLSAGMKQMLAVAMLWALKDATGRKLPVVIDTPVARLDKVHQDAVLFTYLPKVSEQVILLPTDAELDDARLARLAPHIYRYYTLENPSGGATSIRPQPIPGEPSS